MSAAATNFGRVWMGYWAASRSSPPSPDLSRAAFDRWLRTAPGSEVDMVVAHQQSMSHTSLCDWWVCSRESDPVGRVVDSWVD